MANEKYLLTDKEIIQVYNKLKPPNWIPEIDRAMADAATAKVLRVQAEEAGTDLGEEIAKILNNNKAKWVKLGDSGYYDPRTTNVKVKELSALFTAQLTESHQKGLDEGIKKTMDAADSTFSAQLAEAVKKERERIFNEIEKHETPTVRDLNLVQFTMCREDWQAIKGGAP